MKYGIGSKVQFSTGHVMRVFEEEINEVWMCDLDVEKPWDFLDSDDPSTKICMFEIDDFLAELESGTLVLVP